MQIPQFSDIITAHDLIKPYIHNTPVLSSKLINGFAETEIFFKCENFQKAGAFKFRGAINSVLSLSDNDKKNGVAAHSSGNHAGALALAANMSGIKASIVMPENAPDVKKAATKSYGAEITFCKPTLEARESTLEEIVKKTGAKVIHPYDYFQTICGAGTAAIEFLEEKPEIGVLITPVGGGGLLSGSAISAKALKPQIEVIGAEPEGADDAKRSLEAGEIIPSINPNTICDGLLTSLGKLNFEIIKSKVDDILTTNDKEILYSMKLIYERMKIIIEPSCAVALAIVIKNKEKFKGKKVGIIVSGGNVDLSKINF